MKDKIVKTGKTKSYYVLKTTLLVTAFIVLALIILCIPVGISYGLYLKSVSSPSTAEQLKNGLDVSTCLTTIENLTLS